MEGSDITLFSPHRGKRQRVAAPSGTAFAPKPGFSAPSAAAKPPLAAAAAAAAAAAVVDDEDAQEGAAVPETDAKARSSGIVSTSATDVDAATASFQSLGISDWLVSVCASLGMARPTSVQQGCIPAVLAGKDVIGLAQTGSGKTAAFALPILQKLAQDPYGVYVLVLTPTRELAIQIAEQFRALGSGMNLKDLVVIGGVDMQAQAKALARRPHVVVATPGRLKGLIVADPSLGTTLKRAAFLVLDEADRLLEPSFEGELRTILSQLPPERQTLLFSATMTQALIRLQSAALGDDAHVFQAYEGLQTASRLREQYVFLPLKVKEVYLSHLLNQLPDMRIRSAILFTSTCRGCELLATLLEELGHKCAALHSGKSQKQRLSALSKFKSEQVPLLLATDVASRGLDIPSVDLVVNYDLPMLARDYVHRVGRTARAGRAGWSLSFVTQYDIELVHKIEELVGHELEAYDMPEAEVLKGITKVYSAKRAAMLRLAELEGLDTRHSKNIRKAAKGLEAS